MERGAFWFSWLISGVSGGDTVGSPTTSPRLKEFACEPLLLFFWKRGKLGNENLFCVTLLAKQSRPGKDEEEEKDFIDTRIIALFDLLVSLICTL
jgi:hypothetical protein